MFHSTAREAAQVAADAGAKKLVLGHFSSRYQDLNLLLTQAREVFPETWLAEEGKVFEI
jgi:ribonuclease Z